jgi:NADPH-dependent glutamate synthase beta subunit-like oxidoreductase/2,4-dienoyl-CoA reductase-like NADH-dependent reductase (Old Yellow Enzyme family)
MGLFSPIQINQLTIPNRVMMSPAFSNSATKDGHVTRHTIRHYAERARSGVGLIMTEHTSVSSHYLHPGNRLQVSREEHVDGLARLVNAVHQEGCLIGLQIAHSIQAVGLKPEDLSKGTCQEIIEDYVAGARRGHQAGFDLIELHYAHTYTMADFLSRRTNGRTDEFGGDIYGRMRIHLEIIRRIRALLGRDYPLLVRFSAEEFVLNGNTLKQTRIFAQEMEKATIDCLDVSVGVRFDDGGLKGYSDIRGKPTAEYDDGPNVMFAEEIKKVVGVPVITVGKLGNPQFAAKVIEQGRADMVALARPMIADPMWTDKVRRGRFDLIHECIYCNSCLYDCIREEDPVRCLTHPCRNECPAEVDIPAYVELVAQGRIAEAYAVIQEENPLPLLCGRVCHHPCESACNRRSLDEPVAIRDLKRVVTDEVVKSGSFPHPPAVASNGHRIAIVGSGPSGLTCAFYLAKSGYDVTLFEAMSVAGGIPAIAIPEYRLPRQLLEREIRLIQDMGVRIVLNTTVGRDLSLADLKAQGYEAVYLAVGATLGSPLRVPGEQLPGIRSAIPVLQDIKFGCAGTQYLNQKVIVIGGGNVAMDAARSLLRLGARVRAFCLEAAEEMPASSWEIQEAREEGVEVSNGWGPREFLSTDQEAKVGAVVFKRCMSVLDRYGNFRPVYDESTTLRADCDQVVVAAGQKTDTCFNQGPATVALTPGGRVGASRGGQTSDPMIFAGGDCVSGPDSVVGAVQAGKIAAAAMDKHFGGSGEIIPIRVRSNVISHEMIEEKTPRLTGAKIALEQRVSSFTEMEQGLSLAEAIREARRCRHCDVSRKAMEL